MHESRVGYVHVTPEGATLHTRHGGNFVGGTERVRVRAGTEPGWYRCRYAVYVSPIRWSVDLGKRVDPAKERARLLKLVEGNRGTAHTGKPGIAGYQERENASRNAAQAQREVTRNFAELMRRAAENDASR